MAVDIYQLTNFSRQIFYVFCIIFRPTTTYLHTYFKIKLEILRIELEVKYIELLSRLAEILKFLENGKNF